MVFETIPLHSRAGLRELHIKLVNVCFSPPYRGSAKCLQRGRRCARFCTMCLCNLCVLQFCFAIVFCDCAIAFCDRVSRLWGAIVFSNSVLQQCFANCVLSQKSWQLWRPRSPNRSKSPRSLRGCKVQEVVADGKSQEVLTAAKHRKSQ